VSVLITEMSVTWN